VNASKLMARKRPRLIPVMDKHVIAALQAPKSKYWTTMRDALGMNQLCQQVERTLRGSTPTNVSTLRLLDCGHLDAPVRGRQRAAGAEPTGAARDAEEAA